jgi:UDP-GlcNAc:undecaprenyl-phosphate GlcNAc-1-phosphate transferase
MGTRLIPRVSSILLPVDLRSLSVIAAVTIVTLIGLLDDRRSLSPTVKLSGEVLTAALVVAAGYRIKLVDPGSIDWLNVLASIVWLAAVMNAINMMDGLDGLAAGVCLIIAAGLLGESIYYRNDRHALILTAIIGAIIGFLPFNFNRARIFLGDSGSLLLGLLLGLAAIQQRNSGFITQRPMLPLVALGLPLAELFLTVGRRLLRELYVIKRDDNRYQYSFFVRGWPKLFTPDADHMHHRLLKRGLGSVRAVLTLYAISALVATVGLLAVFRESHLEYLLVYAIGLFWAIRFFEYVDLQPFRRGFLLPLLGRMLSAPRGVSMVCDLSFAALSLVMTFAFFGIAAAVSSSPESQLATSLKLCAVLATQTFGLYLGGLYRESYLITGSRECIVMMKSVVLSVLAGLYAMYVLWHRIEISFVILDGYLLATLVIGLRLSFAILDHVFQNSSARRILIYGTDHEASIAAVAIRSDPDLRLIATGFVEDSQVPGDRWFKGLRVYRTCELPLLARRQIAEEVLVPIVDGRVDSATLQSLRSQCSLLGLRMNTYIPSPNERVGGLRTAD